MRSQVGSGLEGLNFQDVWGQWSLPGQNTNSRELALPHLVSAETACCKTSCLTRAQDFNVPQQHLLSSVIVVYFCGLHSFPISGHSRPLGANTFFSPSQNEVMPSVKKTGFWWDRRPSYNKQTFQAWMLLEGPTNMLIAGKVRTFLPRWPAAQPSGYSELNAVP